MAHRRNDRPTLIYWLVDTRTGIPFYCGKTVLPVHQRLAQHKYEAANGNRRVHARVRECGESIRIHLMETVPPDGDWSAREKRWIYQLRGLNPDCCNTANGGAGAPGRIVSVESRAKMSAWQQGRKLTVEHRAKLSAFMTGKAQSPEHVARLAALHRGKPLSAEHRAKLGASQKGRVGKPHTAETRAKIRAGNTGKKRSPETLIRMSEGHKKAYAERVKARALCPSTLLSLPA